MKFSCVYVEEAVRDSPRVAMILSRITDTPVVPIERYGEVFNRRSQNFRLQKANPALILAEKYGKLVLPAPAGYGFGDLPGFYFSHMFNCLYDCRYCFLQGMYRSANYVLFTNYEDFADQILSTARGLENPVFYSGYDCDSLALEPVSGFVEYFIPWFAANPDITLELRTKSTQIRNFTGVTPLSNCVIAMSFTPEDCYRRWEHKVPSIQKRIDAMVRLQQAGWSVALRFEPLIYETDFLESYRQLFENLFTRLNSASIHSVSFGEFRMPVGYFKNIAALYPDEALIARSYVQRNNMMMQDETDARTMLRDLESLLFRYISQDKYYYCG